MFVAESFCPALVGTASFGSGDTFGLTLANDGTFELRHATEKSEHELGYRRRIQRVGLPLLGMNPNLP